MSTAVSSSIARSAFPTARARAFDARRPHRCASNAPIASASTSGARESPEKVRQEMSRCFDLVERHGRGAVYLGSARVGETHPHYARSRELAREVATTLGCTTWSGLGPGIMDAVTRGALDAGKTAAGFMILLEAGGARQETREHPYLPSSVYLNTSFFSARKHGLVDAGVRQDESEKTAFFALPGGVGTLDEIFKILALLQLKRIGSAHPVPFIVMNYDGCYDGLLAFLQCDMVEYGALKQDELKPFWVVCETNEEALTHLKQFYSL